jgi:hypothetical protein
MEVRRALLALALAACTASHTNQEHAVTNTATTDSLARLKQQLATAQEQTEEHYSGNTLPAADAVTAIVDKEQRPWWEQLSAAEAFLLFEISPSTAARAPIDAKANAYCAGVASVSAEWWGLPGAPHTEPAARLLALGKPVAACLVKLFDDERVLKYIDGEARGERKHNAWTVADLAAGLVATIVGATYEATKPPAERAKQRAALRGKL